MQTFVMTGLRDRRIIGNCAYVSVAKFYFSLESNYAFTFRWCYDVG